MKLIGDLKKRVEATESKEETKRVIAGAGMELTDNGLAAVSGGKSVLPPEERGRRYRVMALVADVRECPSEQSLSIYSLRRGEMLENCTDALRGLDGELWVGWADIRGYIRLKDVQPMPI